MRAWLGGVMALAVSAAALAQQDVDAPRCMPTPRLNVQHYPGAQAIAPTNNLARPTGKALPAQGQGLVLRGYVLDQQCVPVQNAKIELWQVNPFGRWMLASAEDRANPNPVFAGAGRTYTDNTGQFTFITLFPAELPNKDPRYYRAPHLSLKISAPTMRDFTTVLYFGGDERNARDAVYKQLRPAQAEQVELRMQALQGNPFAQFIGFTDIVLPQRQRYRGY